jgi:hypothetical protein
VLNVAKENLKIAPGKAKNAGDFAFIRSCSNQGDDQFGMRP